MGMRSFVSALVERAFVSLRPAFLGLLATLSGGSGSRYRPEAHYMRGPGPKWREKHAHRRKAAGLIQHGVS
jgi:hypothetical protein